MNWYPRVADGLLYAVLHGDVPASAATPEFIRKTIMNKSWVLVPSENASGFFTNDDDVAARPYPSPVDLCETEFTESEVLRKSCYDSARDVKSSPLRCFALDAAGMAVRSFGAHSYDPNDQDKNTLECRKAILGKLG